MSFSFWSDEDRLFVPRMLGWSINFKYIAKKLGWIGTSTSEEIAVSPVDDSEPAPESREERLRRSIERSKTEDG